MKVQKRNKKTPKGKEIPQGKAPARGSSRTGSKAQSKGSGRTVSKAQSKGKASISRNESAGRSFRGRDDKWSFEGFEVRENVLFGRNPVMEALKSGKQIDKIMLQEGARNSCGKILSLAKDKGVRVDYTNKQTLDKMTGEGSHQGILCLVSQYEYAALEDVLENVRHKREDGNSILVLLDEIEDPHNLGAIMRSSECTGVDAIIIPKRRGVGLTETVAKTSAGAIEYMPCVRVNNLVSTIDRLKEEGYWICGTDMDGESLWSSRLTGNLCIIIGNEGKGISRLVREKCDFIVSIPMTGNISSLNASNAAAVILYEALRQRTEAN